MSLSVSQYIGMLGRTIDQLSTDFFFRIGYYAFHTVISQKNNTGWSGIVAMLFSIINSRRYKRARSKLTPTLKEVQQSMNRILY